MTQAARLGFKNRRAGVLNWLAEPGPMRGLDFFSSEVRLFAAAVLKNPSEAYYDLMLNYKDAPLGTPPGMLLKFLGEHKELLNALGGEVAIGIENPILPVPNIKIAVEMREPAAFAPLFDALIDQVVAAGQAAGQVVYVDATDYKGRMIYSFVVEGAPVELAWATVGDFLVLGPGPRFVQHSIDVHDSGHSIADDSRLLDLLPQERGATFSLLVYQNVAAVIPQLLKARLLPALGAAERGLAPDLSFMERYSAPGIAYAYADDHAIDFYLNAPSGIDLNMGMAVPVVADWLAKRTSIGQTVEKVVQAEDRLARLAAAATLFKQDQGHWPQSLADLLAGNGGSLDRIPEDPFGAAPGDTLRMTAGPGPDQVTFYSIGPDGNDDRGAVVYDPMQALEGKGDIAVTLPVEVELKPENSNPLR